jgi:putative endonuclease
MSDRACPRSPYAELRRESTRGLGALGEQLAAAHLRGRGFRILATNVRTRYGEIDLIALDKRVLIFCEVKTRRVSVARTPEAAGHPLSTLSTRQRARIRRLAGAWLGENARARLWANTVRFDAIGVQVDRDGRLVGLDHLEGAW